MVQVPRTQFFLQGTKKIKHCLLRPRHRTLPRLKAAAWRKILMQILEMIIVKVLLFCSFVKCSKEQRIQELNVISDYAKRTIREFFPNVEEQSKQKWLGVVQVRNQTWPSLYQGWKLQRKLTKNAEILTELYSRENEINSSACCLCRNVTTSNA